MMKYYITHAVRIYIINVYIYRCYLVSLLQYIMLYTVLYYIRLDDNSVFEYSKTHNL